MKRSPLWLYVPTIILLAFALTQPQFARSVFGRANAHELLVGVAALWTIFAMTVHWLIRIDPSRNQ